MLPEAVSYLERISNIRDQIATIIREAPEEALNWRPVDDDVDDHITNSLAVMATHVAGAEHFWIGEVVGQYPPTRNRDAEFLVTDGKKEQLLALFTQTGEKTKSVLEQVSEETLGMSRKVNGRIVPVRWAILHVIDHSSLHLGHIQLTYQLWNYGQASDSPRWFQRLKS